MAEVWTTYGVSFAAASPSTLVSCTLPSEEVANERTELVVTTKVIWYAFSAGDIDTAERKCYTLQTMLDLDDAEPEA